MSEPRELPQGWAWAKIGEVASDSAAIQYGVLKPGEFVPGGVPMLRVKDIRENEVDTSEVYRITPALHQEFKRTTLHGGEVLISVQGTVGRVAIVPDELQGANVSRTIAVIPPLDRELGRWLHAYLTSPEAQGTLEGETGGSTRDSLNIGALREIRVPVAPLAEQRRIVAKLDELLARSRRAREALAEVPALVARYRESVLAAAFRGDLTADWREAQGQAGVNAPTTLPSSWRRVRLEDATTLITSGSRGWSGYQSERGARFIRVGDLRRNDLTVDIESAIFVDPPRTTEGTRTQVRQGDIFISITADVGMVGVLREDAGEAYVSQHVALCRPKRPEESVYLGYALLDPINVQASMRDAQYGATKASLSLKQVREFMIPLAPPDEQREIVRRIEAAFARIDAVEAAVAEQRARLDAYDRSLLARAFAGELVPQDPADEPAAVLLARLRAERGEAAPARGRRRRG